MFRKIDYFYTSIKDEPGSGSQFLAKLASRNVDLLAVTAIPFGPDTSQLSLFPKSTERLVEAAKLENITLDGPHAAIFVKGEDRVGAFAAVLAKVAAINVNVFSVQGMTDGGGCFVYIIYLRPSDIDQALRILNEKV